jgi:general secretion pathway protein G
MTVPLPYATPPPSIKQPFSILPFLWLALLLAILAFAFLASIFYISSHRRGSDAKLAATQTDLQSLSIALSTFQVDTGRLPTTTEGLSALLTPSPALPNGPYIQRRAIDPWGNPYVYRPLTPTTFDLRSAGPDGKPNTPDDIIAQ